MIQSRTARVAVSASSVRGRGNRGTVAAARRVLGTADLRPFGTADAHAFARSLDRLTRRVLGALPATARHWGIARKVVNIFLRDAFYTRYLSDAHRLERAEPLFELPLDSYTATKLIELAPAR